MAVSEGRLRRSGPSGFGMSGLDGGVDAHLQSQHLIVHPDYLLCTQIERGIKGRKVRRPGLSLLLRVKEGVRAGVVDLRRQFVSWKRFTRSSTGRDAPRLRS